MQKQTTLYFGEKELPLFPQPRIASNLEFDKAAVDRIAQKVFDGMDNHKTGVLTKDDMRRWTQAIMKKKHPNMKFNEEMFSKGFEKLDVNKNGKIDVEEIRKITLAKVQKEKLFVAK